MNKAKTQSLLIGTFAGIPVKIHWSFGFILILIAYVGIQNQLSTKGFIWLGITVFSLFTCVVLHEYGHALAARRFGVRTKDILLTPIGGIARLNGMPKKPIQEFLIAIAGPAVNVALMILAAIYLYFAISDSDSSLLEDLIIVDNFSELVVYLFFLNFVLFAFNLVPAFPMDGGRILRSLLSMKMSRLKATQIASVVGRIFAVIFVVIAIYFKQFSLGFIGVFVFIMAGREFRMIKVEEKIRNAKVKDVLRKDYTVIYNYDPIQKLLEVFNNQKEKSFLVFNQFHQVEGVIHEYFLKNYHKQELNREFVYEVMTRKFEYVDNEYPLESLFHLMQNNGYSILPVHQNGVVIGVVDRRDLMAFIKNKASK